MSYESLYHYGIKGMKWGVRRFQNKDGSLTSSGKKRYYAFGKEENDRRDATKREKRETRDYKKKPIGKRVFDVTKEIADRVLDRAESKNFFDSDDIFSEKSKRTASRISNTRDFLDNLDYEDLTSKNKSKIKKLGKEFVRNSLDDDSDNSFFNKSFDDFSKIQRRNDFIKSFFEDD